MEVVALVLGSLIVVLPLLFIRGLSQSELTKKRLRRASRILGPRPSEGMRVKVVGSAQRVEADLSSPISQRRCIAWRVLVQATNPQFGEQPDDTTTQDGAVVPVFRIQSEHGVVEVRSTRAEIAIDAKFQAFQGADVPHHVRSFLEERGFKAKTWAGTRRGLHIQEAVLEVGTRVAVEGEVQWELDPTQAASYRETGKRLVLTDGEEGCVRISDDPTTFH